MNIKNLIYTNAKKICIPCLIAATPLIANTKPIPFDTFDNEVKVTGSNNPSILHSAPNPNIKINGKNEKAKFVINLTKNTLYKYDSNGTPEMAYLVASGKNSTPTHTGVRVVSHVETFPYQNAPRGSKRRQNPRDYGPKIIILDKIDTANGERSPIGEFIHGNRNSSTLGKHVSHGCIRMDNDVIMKLSNEVKRGDIVIIQK